MVIIIYDISFLTNVSLLEDPIQAAKYLVSRSNKIIHIDLEQIRNPNASESVLSRLYDEIIIETMKSDRALVLKLLTGAGLCYLMTDTILTKNVTIPMRHHYHPLDMSEESVEEEEFSSDDDSQ